MIPKVFRAHPIVELCFPGIRPKSTHRPNLSHFITILLFTIASFPPTFDIPLDKIHVFSYALCVDTDRASIAIPIDATGGYRQEQCPTNEIETDKKDAR